MRGKIKQSIIYFFAILTLVFEWYFGVITLVSFIIQVILIAVVTAFILRIIFRNKELLQNQIFRLARNITAFFGVFLFCILGFLSYHTVFPGHTADIIISDGTKKVHFLSMSHIATENFYQDKKESIKSLAASGSMFLIEWVWPGSKESSKIVENAIGFPLDMYHSLAEIARLSLQDTSNLLEGIPVDRIENTDISLDEMAKMLSGETTPVPSWSLDSLDSLRARGEELTWAEQQFFAWIFRAFGNWSLKNIPSLEKTLLEERWYLMDVIIRERNNRVIERIITGDETHITVIYGALHFEWIYNGLRSRDQNWKIESFTSKTPYSDN
jgi:hypothetical protein